MQQVIRSQDDRIKQLEAQVTDIKNDRHSHLRPINLDMQDPREVELSKCCSKVEHWTILMTTSLRIKPLKWVSDTCSRYRFKVDQHGNYVLHNGEKIKLGDNECWLNLSRFNEMGYKWAWNCRFTCPNSGMINVNLYMSVYKLIALMNLEDYNDPLIKLAIEEKVEASHLCNSGPCCNPAHIILETSERNQVRKQHQHGRIPCDCEVPCLRNGLVWYVGEEKGLNTHPNLVHEIKKKELTDGVLEKISRYNESAKDRAAELGAEHDDFVPRPNRINAAIDAIQDQLESSMLTVNADGTSFTQWGND